MAKANSEMLETNGWVTPTEAARRAGLSYYRIERMIASGSVGTLVTPGTKLLANWFDVERALAGAIRPARAAAARPSEPAPAPAAPATPAPANPVAAPAAAPAPGTGRGTTRSRGRLDSVRGRE